MALCVTIGQLALASWGPRAIYIRSSSNTTPQKRASVRSWTCQRTPFTWNRRGAGYGGDTVLRIIGGLFNERLTE